MSGKLRNLDRFLVPIMFLPLVWCAPELREPTVVHDPAPASPAALASAPDAAIELGSRPHKSRGTREYVPVYATVYLGDGKTEAKEAQLTNRLQIRNISEAHGITLTRIDYFNTAGVKIEKVLAESIEVKPMETRSFTVLAKDDRAGSGGNFVVEWSSAAPVVPPVIETVNAFVNVHRAFVFLGEARTIAELNPESANELESVKPKPVSEPEV